METKEKKGTCRNCKGVIVLKKLFRKVWRYVASVGINTWLLWLILMMMFGNYSQKYYVGTWGISWHMEVIAPYVYYASNIMAMVFIVLIIIAIIVRVRNGRKN